MLASVITVQASAQATNGSIRGTISDQTGAILPKSTIHIKHLATNVERSIPARDDGTYTADNLPPGEYEIQIEAADSKKIEARDGADTNIEVTFRLLSGRVPRPSSLLPVGLRSIQVITRLTASSRASGSKIFH